MRQQLPSQLATTTVTALTTTTVKALQQLPSQRAATPGNPEAERGWSNSHAAAEERARTGSVAERDEAKAAAGLAVDVNEVSVRAEVLRQVPLLGL